MKYFDSHAHYYDERFGEESREGVDNLIDTLLDTSVSYIINVGTSPDTCRQAAEQAKKHKNMYTALGIHPSDTRFLGNINSELCELKEMILNPDNKCVLLGEIGLDYHYPDTDKERQMLYFERQMQLAAELDIPVCIHDRDAHGDVMEVIRRHKGVRALPKWRRSWSLSAI